MRPSLYHVTAKLSRSSNRRKTIPYRRSNTSANFSIAASRGPAPFEAPIAAKELPLLGNKDQRPANSMLARFVLRRRLAAIRPKVGRLLEGTRSARNPSKLSDVTRPSAASCDEASSTWEGNRLLRLTNSLKKSAPPFCSASNTA